MHADGDGGFGGTTDVLLVASLSQFDPNPEDFGCAGIPSGYRVTFTVPLSKAACGLVTPNGSH